MQVTATSAYILYIILKVHYNTIITITYGTTTRVEVVISTTNSNSHALKQHRLHLSK